MKLACYITGAAAAITFAGSAAIAQESFVTIGTGGVTGVYYPAGGAICRLVNKDRKTHGIRCSVESTGGSVYNTRTIRQGELDFGMVQSNVQSDAISGSGDFKDDAFEGLRAVFAVHPEPLHIMVRADAGIEKVFDFKDKRVNIGNPGSGQRTLAEVLIPAAGLSMADLGIASELKSSEQSAALCDGKIDAAVWAAGIPNGSTMEATSTCDIKLMDMTDTGTFKVLDGNPAYAAATIPGGIYPGNPDDIISWGTRGTFVTSIDTPEDIVYAVTKAVFDNFEDFKKLHPAFNNLTEADMITKALSADLHPGALKYYKEREWM